MISYFNFKKIRDKYLITNDLGRYDFLSSEEFSQLIKDDSLLCEEVKDRLEDKYFVYYSSKLAFTERVFREMRVSKNYVFSGTSLHIFVVTTACNHQCIYCQAQNGKEVPTGMMSAEIAKKAVDVALQSPEYQLDFEFQGGEPLLNWPIVKYIVEYTEQQLEANSIDHSVRFNIVTNLTLLTDEMIEFIKCHHIGISTSIDGDEFIHNQNRPLKSGMNSYENVLFAIEKLRQNGIIPGALETTTRYSLPRYKEIVDAYVRLGFNVISLRNLTPLGCADRNWNEIGYTADEYVDFYKKTLNYIMRLNLDGYYLKESIASTFLQKILYGEGVNYMELRSPCGAGVGQIAYYYDGRVFTCDEGRMLAEMGDNAFQLGDVRTHNYTDLMESTICKITCSSSILESLPSCSECAYQPYCGTCPVVTYASKKNLYENAPGGYKCGVYKGILDSLFDIIYENDPRKMDVLRSWVS